MKIHPIVYIIIGFAVAIISYNVDYTKLILFFWVGIIFIMVGLVKFLFRFLQRELKETKTQKKTYQHIKNQENQSQKVHYNQHLNSTEIFCHNCGAKLNSKFNFCPGCGTKIK
jgi:membrane protease subunit (stomatin/prohibitin family)